MTTYGRGAVFGCCWAISLGLIPAVIATTGCGNGGTASQPSSVAASSAGAGGSGGGGGQTGAGGCLDTSGYCTILDPGFCAVGIYEAGELFGHSDLTGDDSDPTWGSHGGPLTRRAGANGSVQLVRWFIPDTPIGILSKQETEVAMVNPPNSVLTSRALDLPFFGWTALAWWGPAPNTQGEIVLVKNDTTVDKRYAVNQAFSLAALPAAMGQGRLIYSGLSKIEDSQTQLNGLYAADSCGSAAMPSLLPGSDPTCGAPLAIHTARDRPGPVLLDADGNAIVFLVWEGMFTERVDVFGFAAPTIARGAPPTAGNNPFYDVSPVYPRAAIAPEGTQPGLLVFKSVVRSALYVQKYTRTGDQLTIDGGTLEDYWVEFDPLDPQVTVMIDATRRVWLGIERGTKTVFVVLARRPS